MQHHKTMFKKQSIYSSIIIGLLALMLVACGGGSDNSTNDGESSEATTNRPAVATMPAPNFSSVGKQSEITKTMDSETEVEEGGPDLALGERVYSNHCAECHGPEGEGGDAIALTKLALDLDAFEDLLRTGGEIGPTHLFGPQKVSPGGLAGLHAYLAK